MGNPVAASVLGTAGAVCWSVQLIPQIIINYRRHDTTGLQPSMMMLWAWAGVPLGVYNITKEFNLALRIQPQILTVLSLATWIQCQFYAKHWPVGRCLAIVGPCAILMAGIQAGLIFALRAADGLAWPDIVMAVLSATLLAAGVLRHYWDIYLHRSVRGISFIFVAIDAAGDLFSLVSVFFQPEPDLLGMIIYGTELALWLGVFAAGGYYNLVPGAKIKIAKLSHHCSHEAPELVLPDAGPRLPRDSPTNNDIVMLQRLHSDDGISSSTSVFRTPSGALAAAKARASFPAVGDAEMGPHQREHCGP